MGDSTILESRDGWTVEVVGTVNHDGGWTGGHTSSSSGFFCSADTMPQDVGSAIAERSRVEQELADTESAFRVTVRRGDLEVVVHDERSSPRDGGMELQWPGFVCSQGLLLRRTAVDARDERGRINWGSTTLRPWLIDQGGRVRTLDFELGVAPLCELPDGRWLLPGASPLWRDSYAEPLSALAADGTVESVHIGPDMLTTRTLLAELAPELLPEGDPTDDAYLDAFPWSAARAAIDGVSGTIRLLLVDADPESSENWSAVNWVLASVDLNGDRPAELLDRGHRPADSDDPIPLV